MTSNHPIACSQPGPPPNCSSKVPVARSSARSASVSRSPSAPDSAASTVNARPAARGSSTSSIAAGATSSTFCQMRTSGWSYTENASSAPPSSRRNGPSDGSRSNVATRSKPRSPESSASKNAMVDGKRAGMRETLPHSRGDASTMKSTSCSWRTTCTTLSTWSVPTMLNCTDVYAAGSTPSMWRGRPSSHACDVITLPGGTLAAIQRVASMRVYSCP